VDPELSHAVVGQRVREVKIGKPHSRQANDGILVWRRRRRRRREEPLRLRSSFLVVERNVEDVGVIRHVVPKKGQVGAATTRAQVGEHKRSHWRAALG